MRTNKESASCSSSFGGPVGRSRHRAVARSSTAEIPLFPGAGVRTQGGNELPFAQGRRDDFGPNEILQFKNESIYRWVRDIDMIVADSMYTEEEYPAKVGWGDGTHMNCLEMARQVGAGSVVMTHHEPVRLDAELGAIGTALRAKRADVDPKVVLAREGMMIDIGRGE